MTAQNQAIYEFWSNFSYRGAPIPAYISGHVPSWAEFPYFTFEVSEGEFGSSAFNTAHIWFQQTAGFDAHTAIAEVLDDVEKAIPNKGRLLRFVGGGVWLRRNDADFVSYYTPKDEDTDVPTGSPVRGGRISYQTHFFVR